MNLSLSEVLQCPEKALLGPSPKHSFLIDSYIVEALAGLFNTENSLVGAFSGHGETSQRFVYSSTVWTLLWARVESYNSADRCKRDSYHPIT